MGGITLVPRLPFAMPVPVNRNEQEWVLKAMQAHLDKGTTGEAMLLTWVLLGDGAYVQFRLSQIPGVRRDYSNERG